MKTLLHYLLVLSLLLPSYLVQGQGSAVAFLETTSMSTAQMNHHDCHEMQDNLVNQAEHGETESHDCCEEEPSVKSSVRCNADCEPCAEDLSSHACAILMADKVVTTQVNQDNLLGHYSLPASPDENKLIPPII